MSGGMPPHKAEVDGFVITSVEGLPSSGRGGRGHVDTYRRVIDKFLQLGDGTALVELNGRKGRNIYSALLTECKRSKERRCYPTVRGGACYLVRIRPTDRVGA
jgi:hypothetical protein